MKQCQFCSIIQGELPSKKVYEDDKIYAFEDTNPQAPVHILVIPKKHISSLNELSADENSLMGHLLLVCSRIAQKKGIAESGYRLVSNCGAGAGQSVFHLHCHLLGGRRMGWPPG